MLTDKEKAQEIGRLNADAAIDQRGAYSNVLEAIHSYAKNVFDTSCEQRVDEDEALRTYFAEVARQL
jgi:hypothetical protein